MRGIFNVVPVGHGQYGPFYEDGAEKVEANARYYNWVSLGSTEGGEPVKATLAEGASLPELFKPIAVEIELRSGGKLRYHGEPAKAAAVRAA